MRLARNLAAGLCLVGLLAAPAAAQDMTKGLILGFGGGKLSPSPAGTDGGMLPSIIVGGYTTLPLTKHIGLTIEAEYNQKHAKATTGATVSDIKIDYLEVPVMAKLPLFKGFYMHEGIQFAYPLQARTETEGTGKAVDFRDNTTKPDVGLVISLGKAIHDPNVMLEGRYDGGLRKVNTTPGALVQRTRQFALVLRASF
jgi:hypothetical protein